MVEQAKRKLIYSHEIQGEEMSKLLNYLTETKQVKLLNELFVQANEIANMPAGTERDAQIARISMIAELDAVNLYLKLAQLASSKELADVLKDVANEEKVHVGEFEYFVEQLDPEWDEMEDEGEEEAEEKFGG